MKKPKSRVENNFRLFFAKELKKKKRTKNVENKLELNRAESKKRYAVPKKLKIPKEKENCDSVHNISYYN